MHAREERSRGALEVFAPWARLRVLLCALAALQVFFGLSAVAVLIANGIDKPQGLPLWVFPLQMAAFAGVSVALIRGSRGDPRIADLATLLMLIGSSFARAPILLFQAEVYSSFALTLAIVPLDVLQPHLLWRFFSQFPRGVESRRLKSAGRWMIRASGVAGLVLLVTNAAVIFAGQPLPPLFEATAPSPLTMGIVYALALPAVPFALWRVRVASTEEARRAQLFAAGIATALTIFTLFSFAQLLSPAAADWISGPGRPIAVTFIELVILSVPLTTAYAVLVDHALPVRLVLRRALQYGLARAVVGVAVTLPFVWVAFYLYSLRHEPLGGLATGPRLLLLGAATGVGVAAFRARRNGHDAIDRSFFRERYDARQILLAVAEESRRVGRASGLATLLTREIDRALHVERAAVLFAEPLTGELRAVAGTIRPLGSDTGLAKRLAEDGKPLSVDFDRDRNELAALSRADRSWLVDAAAQLLLPMRSSEGELLGLAVLGDKRSELPYSADDRQLLAAIAAAASVTLENRLRLGSAPSRRDSESRSAAAETAWECAKCARLQPKLSGSCAHCTSSLAPSTLPLVVNGKFVLERRVGEGSMGVVYRARDIQLDRPVAIKTLPDRSPEDAARLLREARAMAAVSHPNLAVIYGAESWLGTPLIVTEFLDGGTLADRILEGPVALTEVSRLGGQLAAAIERIHRSGILHRDVKPSNIGFTADREPRLLDFGLAQMLSELPRSDDGLAGTPLYMSPEALAGEAPDASFDLWSLAIVLYEALVGECPVERSSWAETLTTIRTAQIADLREYIGDASAGLSAFFRDALHANPGRRPTSATDFRNRWLTATR